VRAVYSRDVTQQTEWALFLSLNNRCNGSVWNGVLADGVVPRPNDAKPLARAADAAPKRGKEEFSSHTGACPHTWIQGPPSAGRAASGSF
jgi:hypothetical protein